MALATSTRVHGLFRVPCDARWERGKKHTRTYYTVLLLKTSLTRRATNVSFALVVNKTESVPAFKQILTIASKISNAISASTSRTEHLEKPCEKNGKPKLRVIVTVATRWNLKARQPRRLM